MSTSKPFTPEELTAKQAEISRRAKIIIDKVLKIEWLGPDADDDRLTLVALLYAGIVTAASSGRVPCYLATGVTASIYHNAESMSRDEIIKALEEQVRQAAYMYAPVSGSVQ